MLHAYVISHRLVVYESYLVLLARAWRACAKNRRVLWLGGHAARMRAMLAAPLRRNAFYEARAAGVRNLPAARREATQCAYHALWPCLLYSSRTADVLTVLTTRCRCTLLAYRALIPYLRSRSPIPWFARRTSPVSVVHITPPTCCRSVHVLASQDGSHLVYDLEDLAKGSSCQPAQLPPMPESRGSFCLLSAANSIYLVGGGQQPWQLLKYIPTQRRCAGGRCSGWCLEPVFVYLRCRGVQPTFGGSYMRYVSFVLNQCCIMLKAML